MPRTARASVGGICCHVLNRGNGRAEVFHKEDDYAAFLKLLRQAAERVPMRLLGFCLMPNHLHLVVWPREDGDLSHSSGHVSQGRFKAFPIEEDEHLLTVLRYVERNPVRAKDLPVRKAELWPWSSAGSPGKDVERPVLDPGPVARALDWLDWVNRPLTLAELGAVRDSVNRGKPYGEERWQKEIAVQLGLESTLRPRGRPRRTEK